MTIYAVVSSKGGVGKTTLGVQTGLGLHMAGRKVWMVDGDKQGSLMDSITNRSTAGLAAVDTNHFLKGATLRVQVKQQAERYDDVVIDAGGQDSDTMRAALVVADIVVIPFYPRPYDTWALSDMQPILDEARGVHDFQAFALLNQADTSGSDNDEAREAVAGIEGLELMSVTVGRRKAIANASGAGLYITEHKPVNALAAAEISAYLAMLAPDVFPERHAEVMAELARKAAEETGAHKAAAA